MKIISPKVFYEQVGDDLKARSQFNKKLKHSGVTLIEHSRATEELPLKAAVRGVPEEFRVLVKDRAAWDKKLINFSGLPASNGRLFRGEGHLSIHGKDSKGRTTVTIYATNQHGDGTFTDYRFMLKQAAVDKIKDKGDHLELHLWVPKN
jgi:hypothetical protein